MVKEEEERDVLLLEEVEGREGRRKQQDGEDGEDWRRVVAREAGREAVAATLLTAARDDRTTRQNFRMVMRNGVLGWTSFVRLWNVG